MEIQLLHKRARYFCFLSQMNSALKITSANSVPNLVKISEKLHPLVLTKEKILLLWTSVAAHAALNNSIRAVNGTVNVSLTFQIW